MKKLIIFAVTVLYMGAATGANVNLHYCMQKMISWNIVKNEEKKCGKCGMAKSDDCCKDQQKLFKLNTDHKASENNIHFYKLAPAEIHFPAEFTLVSLSSLTVEYPLANAPPPDSGVPLFIRNCVFLI